MRIVCHPAEKIAAPRLLANWGVNRVRIHEVSCLVRVSPLMIYLLIIKNHNNPTGTLNARSTNHKSPKTRITEDTP
jgi:hypothetical protein